MGNIEGMDAGAVRQVAAQLKAQADALGGVVAQVNGLVDRASGLWQGRDSQEFANWWVSQHRPRLQAAQEAIRGLGQSASNNADDQDRASGVSGNSAAGVAAGAAVAAGVAATSPAPSSPTTIPGSTRTWQEVQRDYEANGRRLGLGSYSADGQFGYQCTAWANYRWRELGYTGPLITGNGSEMAGHAGGSPSVAPTAGSMASYGASTDFGHVMIVEQVADGGNRIRVSEMNTGSDGSSAYDAHASEYSSSSWFVRQPDGNWVREGTSTHRTISFAHLPGT